MDDYYIRVDYPNGHLNLVLDEFFPCTIKAARIMFPLINRYAAAAEKEKLRNHLTRCAEKRKKELTDMEATHPAAEDSQEGTTVTQTRYTSGL